MLGNIGLAGCVRVLGAAVVVTLAAVVLPTEASAQAQGKSCFGPGGAVSSERANGRSPQGGAETTEIFERGYKVNRCGGDGKLVESVAGRYISVPNAPDGYVPVSITVPEGAGFRTEATTYGDFVNDPAAAAAWRGEEGERLRASMPDPTPGTDTSRNRREDTSPAESGAADGPSAFAAQVVGPCDDYTYTLFGPSWTDRYYNYYTRSSTFPAGDTTRQEITRGHHSWDYTTNDCGFNDSTNLTSEWAGTTDTTFHTTYDGISVTDFGDMASIGRSNSTTVAYALTWSDGAGNYLSGDQRYNQYKTWVHSGQSSGYDVWNVATHESGHTIGLDGDFESSSDTELTMYCCVSYGETKKRTLGRGDILGMRALYP